MGLIPLRRYFLARALTEPNQRLEDDDLVPRLASGRALPLLVRLAPNRPQLSAEILPGHDRVQDNQWVLLGIETAITLVKVEDPRLTHSCPSLQSQQAALHPNRALGKSQFFEVPIKSPASASATNSSRSPQRIRALPRTT